MNWCRLNMGSIEEVKKFGATLGKGMSWYVISDNCKLNGNSPVLQRINCINDVSIGEFHLGNCNILD